jgi:hypothetical protein
MKSSKTRNTVANRTRSVFSKLLKPVHSKPKPNLLFQSRRIRTGPENRKTPNKFLNFQANQANYYFPSLKYQIIRKQFQARKKLEKSHLHSKTEVSRFSFRVVNFHNHSRRYKLFKSNCLKLKLNRFTDRFLVQNSSFISFDVVKKKIFKGIKIADYKILNIQDAESIHFYEIKQIRCIEQLLLQCLNLPVTELIYPQNQMMERMADVLEKYNQLKDVFEECSFKKKVRINSDDSSTNKNTKRTTKVDKFPTQILETCLDTVSEMLANHKLLSNLEVDITTPKVPENHHNQKFHSFQTPIQKTIFTATSDDDKRYFSFPAPQSLPSSHFLNLETKIDVENFKTFSDTLNKTNAIKKYLHADPFSTPQGAQMLNMDGFRQRTDFNNNAFEVSSNKRKRDYTPLSLLLSKSKNVSNQVTPTPLRLNQPDNSIPAPEWELSDDELPEGVWVDDHSTESVEEISYAPKSSSTQSNSMSLETFETAKGVWLDDGSTVSDQSSNEIPKGVWADDPSTVSELEEEPEKELEEEMSYEPKSISTQSRSQQSLSPNPHQHVNSEESEPSPNAETSIFNLRMLKQYGDLKNKRLKLIRTNRRDKIEVANMQMLEADRRKKEMDRRSDREERIVNERVSFSQHPTTVVPITPRNRGRKVDRRKTKKKKLKLRFEGIDQNQRS